jgi:hypothetical protein
MQNSERQYLQIEELEAKTERKRHKCYAVSYTSRFQYTVLSVALQLFSNAYRTLKSSKKKCETRSSPDDVCTRFY